jgi:hypothetical protein
MSADTKLWFQRFPLKLKDLLNNTYAIGVDVTNVKINTALPAGNNNIGNVDIVTLPALPSGTNTIGNVKITDGTDTALITTNGEIKTINTDMCLEIARGNVSGMSSVHKFGNNGAVGTSYETIWTGGSTYVYPSSAVQMSISSSSVNDDGDPVGTGARTLTIYGLDASYNDINETITMNGTGAVVTTNSYMRVYRMVVRTVGSTGSNVGTISAINGGTTYAIIEPTYNQTLMAFYTVPAGKTAYLKKWYVNTGKASDLEVDFYVRPFGECFQLKEHVHIYESSYEYEFCVPLKYTEKSDIEIRAKTSATTQEVSAGFDLILIDN